MNTRSYFIMLSSAVIIVFSNCKKNDNIALTSTVGPITIKNISGYIQKGPFAIGSSITAFDLNSNLSPTGKSYNTQTDDNNGKFRFDEITLSSTFASFKADGFYYNEVSGALSAVPITLYALCDVSDNSNININILTNLEKDRVKYLVQNGAPFLDAKKQAEKEALAIFEIVKADITASENLNITQTGKDNAILLAISGIVQSRRSENRLTELLAEISNDFKEDGVLNSNIIYFNLVNYALYADSTLIRSNLVRRYGEIGDSLNVSNFGYYIDSFISKMSVKLTGSSIYYPALFNSVLMDDNQGYGINNDNLLALSDSVYSFNSAGNQNFYPIVAYTPQGNSTVTLRISELDTDPLSQPSNFTLITPSRSSLITPVNISGIYSATITLSNSSTFWRYNGPLANQFFEYLFSPSQPGRYLIEYYENNSLTPTRLKTIKII